LEGRIRGWNISNCGFFCQKKCGGEKVAFVGVFADFVMQRGGKSWCFCGGLHGKREQLTVAFVEL
jgi:hypothetical protein